MPRTAPDQESSSGGRIGDRERNRCGIDRDIPQILRARRFEDFRFFGERCHLVDLASARLAVADLFRVGKRQKEMHARIAGVESLGLQFVRCRLLKNLARHRLDKTYCTSNECRWSRIVYFFLVVLGESLDVLLFCFAFEFWRVDSLSLQLLVVRPHVFRKRRHFPSVAMHHGVHGLVVDLCAFCV